MGSQFIHVSDKLKKDKQVILTAVENYNYVLQYLSNELKKDTEFLIECYKKNKETIYINEFIAKFDEQEQGDYNNIFIKDNINIYYDNSFIIYIYININ